MKAYLEKVHNPSTIIPYRLVFGSIFFQPWYNPVCPSDVSLVGKFILLTGGSYGLGYETARGLAQRGATVVIAARSEDKLQQAAQKITDEGRGRVEYLALDLSDLHNVNSFVSEFKNRYPGRKLDILIQNASVWPERHSLSPQGFEIAFATNVLGPHLLLRKLHTNGIITTSSKIITLTGDLYVTENDCSSNFEGANDGGQKAYCRSKIGVMWMFHEFFKKYPNLWMNLVHPGVIANDLTHQKSFVHDLIMITNEQGAQTTLIVASASIEDGLINGAYYHNVCGRMLLSAGDVAMNQQKASGFYSQVEGIIQSFL